MKKTNQKNNDKKINQDIDEYLRKKKFRTFIIIEIVSILLVLIFNLSIIRIVSLTILNSVIFFIFLRWTKDHIKKILPTTQIYNEFKLDKLLFPFLSGVGVIIFSYYLFPKWYGLGITLILISIFMLLFKKRNENIVIYLKKIAVDRVKNNFYDRTYFTIIFIIGIPSLLDLHYNIIPIPTMIYALILAAYFIIIYGMMTITMFKTTKIIKRNMRKRL